MTRKSVTESATEVALVSVRARLVMGFVFLALGSAVVALDFLAGLG
jgi:hypothetical protein